MPGVTDFSFCLNELGLNREIPVESFDSRAALG